MAIQLSDLSVVPGATPDLQQDLRTYTIQGSTEFTFPKNGVVDIYCIGAGGSGASTTFSPGVATGGGAGGTAVMKNVTVTTSDSIIFSCGVGGSTPLSYNSIGIAGNASTVNSNNLSISLTANGGAGGVGSNFSSNSSGISGGAGGTASGGTENYTGGSGGSLNMTGSNSNAMNNSASRVATGGGAVGLNRNGFSGGSVTGTTTSNNYMNVATGGGGLGGSSNLDTFNDTGMKVSSGGGSLGSGYSNNLSYNVHSEDVSRTRPGSGSSVGSSTLKLDGLGGPGSLNNNGSSGGLGGGGGATVTVSNPRSAGSGGIFGGGGGSSNANSTNNLNTNRNIIGGSGGVGAGGGGLSQRGTYSNRSIIPSQGGDGVLMVVYKSIQE